MLLISDICDRNQTTIPGTVLCDGGHMLCRQINPIGLGTCIILCSIRFL